MTLLEPPIDTGLDRSTDLAYTERLTELVAAGDRAAVIEFVLASVGVPTDVVAGMRDTAAWTALQSTAHTQVYDAQLSVATTPQVLAAVGAPVLVVDSAGSDEALTGMAADAARALPTATHRSLPGEWHDVPADLLAPVLLDFYRHHSDGNR